MRISRDHLTFKALVALYEVAQQGYDGLVPHTRSLRFLLAYLHSVSRDDRSTFDEFWQTCQSTPPGPQSGYQRGSYLNSCWQGIARGTGAQLTMEYIERIQSGGKIEADRRREAAEALAASIRYIHHQVEEEKDLKRVNYWRPAVEPRFPALGTQAPSPPSGQRDTGAEDPAHPDSCRSAIDPDPRASES